MALNKSHGDRVRSYFTRSSATPATPTANSDVPDACQKITPGSESLHASNSDKMPIDNYDWSKYGQTQVKSPEGSRSYFRCRHIACCARKVEYRDQYNSIINVVYKDQHKHDPPKIVILTGGNVLSTAKSLKRKSISTHGLKEHPIEVVHSATVIAHVGRRITRGYCSALNKSPGVIVPSSFTRTPTANAGVAEAGQKVTPGSKSLSASEPVKIPIENDAWSKYGQNQVKRPEGSRSYFRCRHSACYARKVEYRDQFDSIINVVYKGQHKHDPSNEVILEGGKVLSTAESRKRKSISTHGLKEHPIEVLDIDDSEIKQRLQINSSESSVLKQPKKPKFIVHAADGMKVSADGYKWRKYREKMVKGNPHPRNCYKCTRAGCKVKKHIQKVVDGSSQMIITYKGLHNHDVPLPRKKTGST